MNPNSQFRKWLFRQEREHSLVPMQLDVSLPTFIAYGTGNECMSGGDSGGPLLPVDRQH